jgi:DNA-binding transcriptional LysR family regulator
MNITELNESESFDSASNSGVRFWLVSDTDAEQFSNYQSVPIISFHRNLVLHKEHPLAKRKSLRFADIVDEPFLALNQRMALESLVNQHLAGSGKQLKIIQRGSDPILFLELINQNKGVMIAAPVFYNYLPFENIRQIPILDSFLDFCPAFVYRRAADLKVQDKLFINYVIEQAHALKKK